MRSLSVWPSYSQPGSCRDSSLPSDVITRGFRESHSALWDNEAKSDNVHSRPPGTLPFAGNGIWFLQARHKLLDWFAQCERQTGFETYEISVPSLPPGIVINDPANIEHVLKNNDIFIKGDFFRVRSWDLFGM